MRQAIITINVKAVKFSEAICYDPKDEEKILMRLAYRRIRDGIKSRKGWLASLAVPKNKLKLMCGIVDWFNKEFEWEDAEPMNWEEFRAWAIRRGFLQIKELTEDDRPSANP